MADPKTPADLAPHLLAIRMALRIDEWPDEGAESRLCQCLLVFAEARQRKRKSDWEAEKYRKTKAKGA